MKDSISSILAFFLILILCFGLISKVVPSFSFSGLVEDVRNVFSDSDENSSDNNSST